MIKTVIRLIVLLAVPVLANAQTVQLLDVRVGETVIHIPAPPEFIEISQLSIKAKTHGLLVAESAGSDLLGVFAPKDVGDLNPVMILLIVEKALKDEVMSASDFQKYKEWWRLQIYPLALEYPEMRVIFIDIYDDTAIGYISLLEIESADTSKKNVMVASKVDVLVKGKILTAIINTPEEMHDVDWVRSTSKEWVRQILSHNE